ncbi:Imm26 family immunity protein [Blastomonas fulva]|jgi:hypothetical protein|uniref:Imm26 family immunity protein n=1 Tax=Blastomonas fulva TaxID=1550728 RepID=UPI003F7113ED
MADNIIKRKRVKLSEGDVFELTLPDDRFGFGIIVKRGGLKNGGTPYIAIFKSAFMERPNLATLVADEVALAGWTMDGLVYHDRWKVIAHDALRPSVPLPNFKVLMDGKVYVTDVQGQLIGEATRAEQELLDFQFSCAPIRFQHAFEALHGSGEWQDGYEKLTPAYAKARITRPSD